MSPSPSLESQRHEPSFMARFRLSPDLQELSTSTFSRLEVKNIPESPTSSQLVSEVHPAQPGTPTLGKL